MKARKYLIIVTLLLTFILPKVYSLEYFIDEDAKIRCQSVGSMLRFLDCYKNETGSEYPFNVDLGYSNYLLDRCSPHAYAISQEAIDCMLRYKEIYLMYHDEVSEYSQQEELIKAEQSFLYSHKGMCIQKGNKSNFFCENYDEYLSELEKYKGLPGYIGIGMPLPDLTKVDRLQLLNYFDLDDITSITKNSDGTYTIQGLRNKKWVGLFKTQVKKEIIFDIKSLAKTESKKWWEIFLMRDKSSRQQRALKENNQSKKTHEAVIEKSPSTQLFEENLYQTNQELLELIVNINKNFFSYGIEYNISQLLNLTITNVIIEGMRQKETEIKRDFLDMQEKVAAYRSVRAKTNLKQLSDENRKTHMEIERKLNAITSNKEKINSCISAIEWYRATITSIKNVNDLTSVWTLQKDLILVEGKEGNYGKALQKIDGFLHTTQRIIDELDKGTFEIVPLAFEKEIYFEAYYNAFIYDYKDYLELMEEGNEDTAMMVLALFNESVTKAEENVMINEDEGTKHYIWNMNYKYEENIGPCLKIFD